MPSSSSKIMALPEEQNKQMVTLEQAPGLSAQALCYILCCENTTAFGAIMCFKTLHTKKESVRYVSNKPLTTQTKVHSVTSRDFRRNIFLHMPTIPTEESLSQRTDKSPTFCPLYKCYVTLDEITTVSRLRFLNGAKKVKCRSAHHDELTWWETSMC